MIELGGNIKLSGFNAVDNATLTIVKKMVGNYAKRINEQNIEYQELMLHLEAPNEDSYELKARLISNGKEINTNETDQNLFFAIDKTLNKLIKEV